MPKKISYILVLAVLILPSYAYSDKDVGYAPLYSGTLLAFFPENVPPGVLYVEPYFFQITQPGFYNQNWSFQENKTVHDLSLSMLFETGITSYLDFSLYLTSSYNQISNLHTASYQDTQIYLGFQLLRDEKASWVPDVRFLLGESFPTGKYQHLDPEKQLSDTSGSGSYETFFIFVTGKTFYVFPKHPFNFNLNLEYIISTKTNVHGYNVYGGVGDSKGRVAPGDQYIVNLAAQYSFTQHFAVGIDIHYIHQNKSTFVGYTGSPMGELVPFVGLPSSDQISLAPCLEYNFSNVFGILTGTWITVAGRNSNSFISNIISVYYGF